MIEFLAVAGVLTTVLTWLVMVHREPHIAADAWNAGYARAIAQAEREAAERAGGPPAPIRTEMWVK
jgi:hypothetical protein